jgi:hypothetical protein
MPTIEQLKTMEPAELRKMSAKMAKILAARIAVGVVVSVTVALISGAVVNQIEKAFKEDAE